MRAVLVLALLLPTSLCAAQAATAGAPVSVDPAAGTAPVRWPDVAYDPIDDAWLAVSGAGNVEGVWLAGDGTPLGPAFVVQATAGIYGQAPRVAWTGAGFLVTWHESVGSSGTLIRGRVVARSGPLTGDFDVSPLGTNWEMGAAVACSIASGECLVAWQSPPDTRIYAQRVALDGTLRGGPISVDARALYFRDPAVVLHAATDTFVVAYAGCIADGNCFVDAQRIRAGTGELVGGPLELDAGIEAGYVPEAAYGAATAEVLVVWQRRVAGAATFEGRRIAADGALAPTMHVSDVGSYDANGLAYAPISNTFLFVSHGTTAEDVAIELSAIGAPLSLPIPFGPATASGNFNPRVAGSSTRAEWLAVTSTEFSRLSAQGFSTASRDPTGVVTDAGPPDLDGGSSAALDASVPPPIDAPLPDGAVASVDSGPRRATPLSGCGCRVRGPLATPATSLMMLALAMAARWWSARRS